MIDNKVNEKVVDFYDKFYNWVITKGPSILLAIVIIFVGFWLIRVFKRWMQGKM